mmetsp:Transcript_10651/g.21104  ORF Transcript_10651/g.21104 Transcript_10651/m.21104 type:complete len:125 (-) Transcript_10651:559-933(-)
MKKEIPKDLLNVYKLLIKAGIKNFENSIPSLILDLIYEFIWDILYKSKMIAKHAGRSAILKIDIEIACKIEFQTLKNDPYYISKSIFSCNLLNSLFLMEKKEKILSPTTAMFSNLLNENFKFKF